MKETKFKYTEIGYIPNDWEVSKWGDVLTTFSSGATPFRGNLDYYKGNNLWISSGELNYNVITETIEHISAKAIQETNLRVHKPNTFLMAITGLEAPGTRGRCAFVGKPACTNQSCLAINSTNKMIVEYLFWFYRAYSDYLAFKYCQGSKQQSYTAEIVKKLPIIVPPLPEQRRIAAALSDIDTLIQKLEILIQKKQNIKQGAMQSLLTGKKRLKGFEGEWCEKKLGEIFEPIPNNTLSRDCLNNSGGEYQNIHYGDVLIRLPEYTDCQKEELPFVNEGYSFKDNAILQSGDVVMADTAEDETAGKVTEIVNAYGLKVVSGLHTIPLRPKIKFASKFLGYAMNANSYHQQLLSLQCGTKVTSVSKSVVATTKLTYPPTIDEQQSIADILTSMDEEIYALEEKKAKYKQVKQGMMQQLLTGKIRLVETTVKSNATSANVHFRRSVLAAEIAERLYEEPTFGHVKMEKMLFLTERLCHIDIGSHYHRDAAGPYDNRALRSIDSQLKKQKWFDVKRTEKGNRYVPMQNCGKHKTYFDKYYSTVLPTFEKIIDTFKTQNTERCEIVATLYSAWEDLLHSNKPFTDADIVNEVLNNWHESKKRISQDRWLNAIQWMRENGFAPNV